MTKSMTRQQLRENAALRPPQEVAAWKRSGWQRHDLMVGFIASLLFPVCLASTLSDRGRNGGRARPGLLGEAMNRAQTSAAMIYQLPG